MTEKKSLKRRVRERMSKTGERYTSARRQVLAKQPSAEAKQSSAESQQPAAEAKQSSADAQQHTVAPQPTADEAPHGPTGRPLSEWFSLLDQWGASDRSHTEIARWLNRQQGVDGWYSQDITVRYEKQIGRRVLGQRGDTFSATATKTIDVPPDVARAAWTDESIRAKWLPNFPLRQRPNRTAIAARFDADVGRVVATFDQKEERKVVVALEHERLPDAATAERLKLFWRERLAELKQLLEG